MYNESSLDNEYNKYVKYKERFHFLKKQKWSFYKNHREEIDKLNSEYMKIEDPNERDEFEKSNQILRTFLIFEWLTERYKVEYKKHLYPENVFEKNKKIIALVHKEDENFDLYDIDTKEFKIISKFDKNKINYIIKNLTLNNSFITYASESQIPMLEVISKDIENKYKDKNVEDNICNEIKIDFFKALTFDSGKYLHDEMFKEKIKSLDDDYKNKKINKEDYLIRYYYYNMLWNHDPETLYLYAPEDRKEYVLEAYFILSSYKMKNEEFTYHERTASKLINKLILLRKYKKENE